jgi:hypothetical protein
MPSPALKEPKCVLVTVDFGIEAARTHPRHRDIIATSAHYVGKKRREEASLSPGSGRLKAVE